MYIACCTGHWQPLQEGDAIIQCLRYYISVGQPPTKRVQQGICSGDLAPQAVGSPCNGGWSVVLVGPGPCL